MYKNFISDKGIKIRIKFGIVHQLNNYFII